MLLHYTVCLNELYFRLMKIVVAPDKFKNALTGLAFCETVAAKLLQLLPHAQILKLPLADGGDGTISSVNHYVKGVSSTVRVSDPFFKPIEAAYLYAASTATAYIEMAEASGVKVVQPGALNCKEATTFGTGQLILDAITKGAKRIILGIGGSATNDCGIGMASALGYQFLDAAGTAVRPIGANLSRIKRIDTSKVHEAVQAIDFQVACDVSNPLYGPDGAAYVYAAQKGATAKEVQLLDEGLKVFSKVIRQTFHIDAQRVSGAGAAGGLGIAAKVFLGGTLVSGITLVKDLAQFDAKIKAADWIITGEGGLDAQTTSGKTIHGVLASAKAQGIKVAAFCGRITLEANAINALGLSYTDQMLHYATSTADAMRYSERYLEQMIEVFVGKVVGQ